METFRLKRSMINRFTDRSSGDKAVSTLPVSVEGSWHDRKQITCPKLASDSSSCSNDCSSGEDLTFEPQCRSSRRTPRTLIKKLDMPTEAESRRRSPSVIARLMGLDGLPPQQLTNTQQMKPLENYQRRSKSAEKAQSNGTIHGHKSFRKRSKEEQEFKDVFEVIDASKVETRSYSGQRSANSKLAKAEMAFVQQKFMDVKRLSTNEKLQHSKEYDDALEALDSNKDLLLKFLQQPDSLFAKHLHDVGGALPQLHSAPMSAMKSSHSLDTGSCSLGKKSAREISRMTNTKSPHKHHDGLLGHRRSRNVNNNSLQSLKENLEEKSDQALVPTQIVVLKPSLGKPQKATRTVSSPRTSYDFRPDCMLPGSENRDAKLPGQKFPDAVTHTMNKSRESRDIAKEITKHMRNSCNRRSMNLQSSGLRGYAGDESSCEVSGSESANESDVTIATSRNSFNWRKQYKSSSSRSTESSVSKEAKKRLSERWKLTHKSVELGVSNRGSTLGEMLAFPDKEMRIAKSVGVIDMEGFSVKNSSYEGITGRVEPLGISSRDGLKYGYINNLSRSGSLPPSPSGVVCSKTSMRRENPDDRYMMTKVAVKREHNSLVKGNLKQRKDFISRNPRSRRKISQPSLCTNMENYEDSPEIKISLREKKISSEVDDSSASNPVGSDAHYDIVIDENFTMEKDIVNVRQEKVASRGHSRMELLSPTCQDNISAGDHDVSTSQEPSSGLSKESVLELQSPASAPEADQPSPVSVLEAPFLDDVTSGSECFESLSADLHGLRMQLHLLKLESESYEERSMLISSDEESGKKYVEISDAKELPRDEDCESNYLVDVLTYSGLNDVDLDTFMATQHSSECHVNPSLFEELEEKYCNLTSWSRSERRLLFDHINWKLIEISKQFKYSGSWVNSATSDLLKWNKIGPELDEILHKSFGSKEIEVNKGVGGIDVTKDSEWLELGEDIDVVGKEMERLLLDELVEEMVRT